MRDEGWGIRTHPSFVYPSRLAIAEIRLLAAAGRMARFAFHVRIVRVNAGNCRVPLLFANVPLPNANVPRPNTRGVPPNASGAPREATAARPNAAFARR